MFELLLAKLLKIVTFRPTRESLLFRNQILFSYYCSVNSFCDNIIKNHKSILCANLTFQNTLITTFILPHGMAGITVYGCDSLTPWSKVLLEKPAGSQLVKMFLACYGI